MSPVCLSFSSSVSCKNKRDFSSLAVVAFLNTSEVTYIVQVGHLSVAGKRHRR